MSGTARRRVAERAGRRGETASAWLLRLKGFRILARRAKTPAGEIDIIARRGRTIAFVEVKARADLTIAAEALTPRQRHRLVRAASAWLARRPEFVHHTIRFDMVLVVGGLPRRHVVAFDAG